MAKAAEKFIENVEFPSFDASKATDQIRAFAEKGVEQSKEAYAKIKTERRRDPEGSGVDLRDRQDRFQRPVAEDHFRFPRQCRGRLCPSRGPGRRQDAV